MGWPANRILQVLQDQGGEVGAQALVEVTGLSPQQVWLSADVLVKRSLASRVKGGVYRITAAGITAIAEKKEVVSGPNGPVGPVYHRGTFRERLWRALRIERKGTLGDFLSLILQPGEEEAKARRNARKYISGLCRAGYIAKLPGRERGTAVTSNGFARYLLLVNNGPLAPTLRPEDKCLYDPNTDKFVKFGGAE